MDDNGHGIYVAGIVAANGGLKGVAPDSKIIAIKVCTSAGSCSDANIMAGMDWCINNATRFNITTISMSIGADCDLQPSECFSSYCNADPIAGRVNQAVGENISVVISTGNDGSSTKISSPSCIQNVTAVSSSTKTNAMSSFANRNSLVDLLAPGGNSLISGSINSTEASKLGLHKPRNYMVCSGTSMAAPHVSGALSLLRQYSSLTSQYTTPDSLQNTLNSTGIGIYDSASGLNFSRIQVYSALISLDNSLPIVNLSSPSNATTTLERNITFDCNATDAR
jgi:serine protease AprX